MYFKMFIFLAAAHMAAGALNNDSAKAPPKTFSRTYVEFESDEPIELPDYNSEYVPRVNSSTPGPSNGSRQEQGNQRRGVRIRVSEEGHMFLISRVSTVFIPLVYTFVFVISVPLNAIALITFARKVRPMKPAVIFMMNLACADLLFALLLPFKMAYHFGGNNWTFGPWMCSLVTAAFYCNMYCSVLLITCISVDRLLAVVYPLESLSWRKPRNAAVACAAMWVLAVGGSLPLLLTKQDFYQTELRLTTCHDVLDKDELQGRYAYFFPTFSCLLFFLPLLITVVNYSRVIWTLSIVPRGVVGRSRRKMRAMVMAATVLVVFMVCFTPTNSLLMAHYLQFAFGYHAVSTESLYGVYLVSMCVGSVSCCLDPLVYYYGSSQCQRQLASVLRCQAGMKGASLLSSSSSRSSTRNNTCTQTTKKSIFLDSQRSQHKKLLV